MNIQVYCTEKNVSSDREAITAAGNVLVDNNKVSKEFIDACLSREVDYPTALALPDGNAIAMPHGGAEYVKGDSISVLRTNTPVEFGRMEDNSLKASCNLIFNLAISSGNDHVDVLKNLMSLFVDKEFIETCSSESSEVLGDYISSRLRS